MRKKKVQGKNSTSNVWKSQENINDNLISNYVVKKLSKVDVTIEKLKHMLSSEGKGKTITHLKELKFDNVNETKKNALKICSIKSILSYLNKH